MVSFAIESLKLFLAVVWWVLTLAWWVIEHIFKGLCWIFRPRAQEEQEAPEEWEELEEAEEEEEDKDESLLALNLDREKRRLAALYDRRDKAEYLNNTSPAAWARYQNTKTWRGLLYDIEAAERKIRLLEGE